MEQGQDNKKSVQEIDDAPSQDKDKAQQVDIDKDTEAEIERMDDEGGVANPASS